MEQLNKYIKMEDKNAMTLILGETPTEALRNAQIECGEDAIVISHKKNMQMHMVKIKICMR